MEQPTLPFPRISVSSQDRPTPDADASWPMGLFSTACVPSIWQSSTFALTIAHFGHAFAFRVELPWSRVSRRRQIAFPRSGIGGFPNFSYTLRPCLSSVAQSCLNDAARLMIVAWSLHLPERPERLLCGTLIQCVMIKTAPSSLMKPKHVLDSGTPTKSITSERHLSICLHEIDRCWRPLAAGSSFFCRPRCCRRAHRSPRIPALQVFPHSATL